MNNPRQSWLSWFLRGTLILLFLILFGKLFEVQVIKGDYYRNLSEQNRIRRIELPAARGKILAKGGENLADNVAIKKRVKFDSNEKFLLTDDLTDATPDEIITDYKRIYPLADKFGHALGYLSQISSENSGKVDPKCPDKGVRNPGTLVGVAGLEKEYECDLRGIPGEELFEVDTMGKKLRTLGIKNPIAGKNVLTSIDYNLQKEISGYMESGASPAKGAAIVTDPLGRVLAFYSTPSYDPNLFIDKNEPVKISALLNNPNLPLFDRVISGTFHPGSVFKPAVALAALEEGAVDKNFRYQDPGVITVNSFTYSNWYFTEYGRREGEVNLARALARSTDTFFYKIGEMTGPVNIAKWADLFGLDKKTGIDLPGENSGLIPTPEWKQKTKKESWFLGNTYNMSIGQGDVSVTPVELNTYITALASYGKLCRPSIRFQENPVCNQIDVAKTNIDLVKEGMKDACLSGGTAYTFFDFAAKHNGQTIACKTGTAEVGSDGIPHAWFTLFTPADKPEIVVTILFERGGQGSSVAGPVARKIVDYYYNRNQN